MSPAADGRLTERLQRALFAPAAPGVVAAFRVLLSVLAVVVFWPVSRELAFGWSEGAWTGETYHNLFFTRSYALAVVAILAMWATGIQARWTGALAVLALLPLVPVVGVMRSRQVLLFAILACTLLPGRGSAPGPMWPIRLIQLQISALYAVNALAKLSPGYLSGDVLIGMSQVLPNFLLDLSDGRVALGPLAIPVALAAFASVAVEAALAVGFWFPRLRIPTAVLGVAFHATLSLVVEIGWLDWVSVALYAAFLLPFERRHRSRTPGSADEIEVP